MKKHVFQFMLMVMMVIGLGAYNTIEAKVDKPPRPEKIEEVKTDQPSEYHRWINGKWKWSRKAEEWKWRQGYWTFDHDLYAFRNRYRFNSFYRPYRYRYYAVPIGRGLYRLVVL